MYNLSMLQGGCYDMIIYSIILMYILDLMVAVKECYRVSLED